MPVGASHPTPVKVCAVENCGKWAHKRGRYCAMHEARITKYGDPNITNPPGPDANPQPSNGAFPCPQCGGKTGVKDSRPGVQAHTIRRRRQCSECANRFTTYEVAAEEADEARERTVSAHNTKFVNAIVSLDETLTGLLDAMLAKEVAP